MNNQPKIQVVIRKRPLNEKEISKKKNDIIDCPDMSTIIVKEMRTKLEGSKYIENHQYIFDGVFREDHNNEDIYETIVKPLISSAFEKTNISFFAYGQTGSGKTYTMMGDPKRDIKGLYLLASEDIFQMLKLPENDDLRVGVSFYEIYCGKAYDLLNDREECPIRVDAQENVNIVGLNEKLIPNTLTLMDLIYSGLTERVTSKNSQNEQSSRSHAVLQITLRNIETGKKHCKISFIDLAGNERGADVKKADKQTQMDGAEINKSLLALKECIRALDQGKKHLPFRGSKLTLVLKDSFQGKCKSVMIGTVTPAITSCEYTLNTLRYADRVRELKEGKKGRIDEMMLSRNKKKMTTQTIPKPREDAHLKFDYYDVNAKSNNQNDFQWHHQQSQEKMSLIKKSASYRLDDKVDKNKSKDKSQSKNFLKGTRSKSPMMKQNSSYKKDFSRTKGENSYKNPFYNNTNEMSTSRISTTPQDESVSYHQNDESIVDDLKTSSAQLVDKYQHYLENLYQIDGSDRRNLQLWQSNSEKFLMCFDKMKKNLDKKIYYINKIKKEIVRVNKMVKEQKQHQHSRKSHNDHLSVPRDDDIFNNQF